jgi:hypothetical protein
MTGSIEVRPAGAALGADVIGFRFDDYMTSRVHHLILMH